MFKTLGPSAERRGGGDFAFSDINFRGMLHNVCDVVYHKKCVDQSELVNVGEQID